MPLFILFEDGRKRRHGTKEIHYIDNSSFIKTQVKLHYTIAKSFRKILRL